MKAARWLVLATLLGALLLFFALDLGRFLTLTALQQRHADLAALYALHPWEVRAGYFALYVAVAALALPGAALLTLAGGAIFGFGWGLALVSFASSLGATLSFLMARLLLRELVQTRFATQLVEINAGVQRAGWLYLLSLVPSFFGVLMVLGFVLLFVIGRETRAVASIAEAAFYIGVGRDVVIVLQPYPETMETLDESLDLNRGRRYLRQIAEECSVRIFDTPVDAIRHIISMR